MKSLLIFIASFSIAFNAYAAEKSTGPEDMPDTFKSGDASKGSSLVASCAACHGSDGNSVSSDWPKLAGLTAYLFLTETGKKVDQIS